MCIFCNIWKDKLEPIIYESEEFYALFDPNPVTPGHALVIPKNHIISRFELSERQLIEADKAIKEVVKIITETKKEKIYSEMLRNQVFKKSENFLKTILNSPYINKAPDGFNIGNNEGVAAGRTIDHLHYQIIPRYLNDVSDPTGGIRNIIPGRGNYK